MTLGEFMIFYEPSVRVFYLNKLGLIVQEIVLDDHNSVKVRQIVYDGIKRPVLKTKWTRIESTQDVLLGYNEKFLTNTESVLSSRKVEGLVSQLNAECEGYPYTWTSYRDDPLEIKKASGLPGKPFSVDGPYSTKFGSNPSVDILKVLFPLDRGFKHEFELNSSGSLIISIRDKHKNKVAELVKVVNHDHRLTTFEFDDKQRLIRELPPMYHHKANSLSKTGPFDAQNVSPKEQILRDQWAKQYRYDEKGRLVEKSTPDSGRQEFLYTEEGLLRFIVNTESNNDTVQATFYTYNTVGEIAEKGVLNIPQSELHQYLDNSSNIPKPRNVMIFDSGENELVPAHRHHVKKSRKTVDDVTITEALIFDENNQLIDKISLSSNDSMTINYKYMNDKVTEVTYPFLIGDKPLKVVYDYNTNQKISSVRIGKRILATMKYTPHDHVNQIEFEPTSPFAYVRQFDYNAPGYLASVKDKFLTENVEYITGSYGGQSLGDGTVSATKFNATWHMLSNVEFIKLKPEDFLASDTTLEQANLCFNTLKEQGFLDNLNRPLRSLYSATEPRLPLVCGTGSRANHISTVMITKGFPMLYGHRYDYENHKQLIKAKYFQTMEEFSLDPLTQNTFSETIRGINKAQSIQIWNALKTASFIITDCSNSKICHALQGKSIFHPAIDNHINSSSLQVLFAGAIKVHKDLPENVFLAVCKMWHKHDPLSYDKLCAALWKELLEKSFVGSRSYKSTNTLNPELKRVLKPHSRYLSEIVSTLYDHFAKALGNSGGDIQSYDIDANGNHVHYYTGFKRYRMEYLENTNKISKLFCTDLTTSDIKEREFLMEHDIEGSVTKAMHKNIIKIVYDPLIKRAKQINLLDGRKIFFQYDVRGERVIKLVSDGKGKISKEKYYLRDIKGRCLIDYEVTHLKNGGSPHVRSTAYIYAENHMLGFIRDDQFYSVYSDHEGSVRLVIRNGEVVAAYDYLPYGQILREYNTDPDASIAYRYTGQEWDEETNLYNYHARLYDPEIGRFYQIDPKEQYPSPYVYAGNSPISFVDPDGEFAFLAVVALAVVGFYGGASAANNSFNPLKWKLKPTLIGGGLGALAGALAPAGIAASFTFLTGTAVGLSAGAAYAVIGGTALGFAFVSSAGVNRNWNPLEWNWSSPATFNALFGGAITGATLFAGIGSVHAKYMTLAGTHRVIFVGLVTSATVGTALFTGAMANDGSLNVFEWNWSSPDTVWKVVMGASFGIQASTKLHDYLEPQITAHVKDLGRLMETAKAGDMKLFVSEAKAYFTNTQDLLNKIKDFSRANAMLLRKQPVLQLVGAGSKQSEGTINTIKLILFEVSKIGVATPEIVELIEQIGDVQNAQNQNEHSLEKRSVKCCEIQLHHSHYFNSTPQSNAITSGASAYASMLSNMFDLLYSQFTFFFDNPSPNDSVDNVDISFPKTVKRSKIVNLPNCYQLKFTDEPSITKCFSWNYQCTIYPKISSHHIPAEDSFSYCTPIDFQGKPSVACDGENSSAIFTINQSSNILDHINGNLMLALIVPASFNNMKNIVNYCCSLFSKDSVEVVPPKSENVMLLNTEYEKLIEKIQIKNAQRSEEIDWLNNIVEDLKDDMVKFSKNGSIDDLYQLLDRIEAVEEELNYVSVETNIDYRREIPISSISENNSTPNPIPIGTGIDFLGKLQFVEQHYPSYLA